MHRAVNPPRRRCCPMCDHGGFRRVAAPYERGTVFQCTNCEHQWIRSHGAPTDRRTTVRLQQDDD